MNLPILVIDKDIEFSMREQSAWLKHGISTVRVDTMQEAIEKLMKESFCFVAINGNNVNYIPMLKTVSEMSSVHIFVLMNDFTIEKQNEAFINGASWCARFQDDPEDNVKTALAYLQSINSRGRPKRVPKIVTCGNLTVIHDHHQVFCNDAEIVLTPKEYNILHYLLMNQNTTLTFTKIVRRIWGTEIVSNNAVWQVIIRLRKKLDESGFKGGDIISFKGVGYRFSPQTDR